MKRLAAAAPAMLLGLFALYPLGAALAAFPLGCRITLASRPACAAVFAVLAVALTTLICAQKPPESALPAPLPILYAANWFLYVRGPDKSAVVIWLLTAAGICSLILLRHTKPGVARRIAAGLGIPLFLLVGFLSLLIMIFGGLETTVQSVPSPQRTYIAQVVDRNEGALGGSTRAEVRQTVLDLGIFRIEKPPVRVYSGRWREFNAVDWKDDHTLVINGAEYMLPPS